MLLLVILIGMKTETSIKYKIFTLDKTRIVLDFDEIAPITYALLTPSEVTTSCPLCLCAPTSLWITENYFITRSLLIPKPQVIL